MARPSFLDKFTRNPRGGPPSRMEHVVRNVHAVLNTKEGYGYFLQGFGLGGYTEKSATGGLAQALAEEIQQAIRQHESRLQEVNVTLRGRDNGLWLHFAVRARLEGQPCRLRVLFDTSTGQVRVEEQEAD